MAVPTQDQVMGQLRVIIPAIGTVISAVGVSSTSVNYYVGIAMTAVGPIAYGITALWSLYANSRKSIMASAAQPVDANTPPPQIVLPKEEAALAQTLPSNVNTTETVRVVSQ